MASREKELERREAELEDEESHYLGTIEELQIRMERDEDRFEQGLENVASWARSEVENDLRAKSRAASSLGKQVSKLQSELKSEGKARAGLLGFPES